MIFVFHRISRNTVRKCSCPKKKKDRLCGVADEDRRKAFSIGVLKLWMREASDVLPGLFQGQVPMQVSVVGDGGKGKESKGKKDKGKGKDKIQSKNGDGSKGKDEDNNRNSSKQAAQLQGFCSMLPPTPVSRVGEFGFGG